MTFISRIADKVGALGSLVSGMGCAVCFPALASVGGLTVAIWDLVRQGKAPMRRTAIH